MSFVTEHADAVQAVRDNGAPVTFVRTRQTYDDETDRSTPVVTELQGVALQTEGDAEEYRGLGLVRSAAVTLLFVPESYGGALPEPDDVVQWGGAPHAVKGVESFAPDGTAIFAHVVASR